MICTSATGVTVLMTGGVTLLVGLGSWVGPPTLALLVMLPINGAVTVSVRLVFAPAARLPRLFQTTCEPISVPPALALTKVTLTGSASVTLRLLAMDGPKLATVMV